MEEDDRTRVERYIHVPVTYATYAAFMNARMTYRDVITSSKSVFVIEKPYAKEKVETQYLIEPKLLPREYLPAEDSFCPVRERAGSSIYIAKLQGGLADDHSAKPQELGEIQVLWGKIIERVYSSFEKILGKPTAVLHPSTAGSFELNYVLRFDHRPAQGMLFPLPSQETYDVFVQEFIEFCLNDLPRHLPDIARELRDSSYAEQAINTMPSFHHLLESFQSVYGGDFRGTLLRSLADVGTDLDKISQTTVGESYKRIALTNRIIRPDAGIEDKVLGVVDDAFTSELGGATEIISKETNRFDEDIEHGEPKTYSIIVYSINRETRRGKARIRNDRRDDRSWSQPTILITGDEPLEGSAYTLSLHEDREIEIRGYAKRIDGRYRHIKVVGLVG